VERGLLEGNHAWAYQLSCGRRSHQVCASASSHTGDDEFRNSDLWANSVGILARDANGLIYQEEVEI
jgi:hypothetical protein